MSQRGFISLRGWVWLGAIAGCVLAWGAAWSAFQSWKENLRDEAREEGRVEIRDQWKEAVRIAQRAEDHKEAERRKAHQEAQDATADALSHLAAGIASSRDAADRLQRRSDELVAAARRQACEGRAAAGPAPGQQGPDPAGMLADMRRRIDQAAGRVGEYATRLRIAGLGCERDFDAIEVNQ